MSMVSTVRTFLFKLYRSVQFLSDFASFRSKARSDPRFHLVWGDRLPQLFDKTRLTQFDAHYIYHPAWAARILARTKPREHVDIGSTLAFASLVSAFIPVRFYDYRPAPLELSGLSSGHADLTALPFANESLPSLSCMHTVEHVGLGRYGDPIDPTADLAAAAELSRVLAPNGNLLFAVPIGKPKIAFNAHRIYSYRQILDMFPHLTLKEFSLIPDDALTRGCMLPNALEAEADRQHYGCGCFWFTKA